MQFSSGAISQIFKPQIKMAVDALHIFSQGPPAVGFIVAKNKGAISFCISDVLWVPYLF